MKNLYEAKSYFDSRYAEYYSELTCIKEILAWSDLNLIRDIIFMLATQGWQKVLDEEVSPDDQEEPSENPMDAIDRLVKHFKVPFEVANAEVRKFVMSLR